jgi:class 3 adenylate cyclase
LLTVWLRLRQTELRHATHPHPGVPRESGRASRGRLESDCLSLTRARPHVPNAVLSHLAPRDFEIVYRDPRLEGDCLVEQDRGLGEVARTGEGGDAPAVIGPWGEGTSTLLFTDMVGSTQLLRELGRDEYGELHDQHHELMRSAVLPHGAHEVLQQGDGFLFAFALVTPALRAAAEAQRAITTATWPLGAAVEVRMGLHTGDVDTRPSGHVGLVLNQGSRIMAAAHGGQVLLSSVTAAIAEDGLPNGIGLRELGDDELRDIGKVPIFQLLVDGLRDAFPPLQADGEEVEELTKRVLAAAADPSTRVIDFPIHGVALPDETIVTTEYIADGVVFSDRDDDLPEECRKSLREQENVVRAAVVGQTPGTLWNPFRINFETQRPVQRVSLTITDMNERPQQHMLYAFDSEGAIVDEVAYHESGRGLTFVLNAYSYEGIAFVVVIEEPFGAQILRRIEYSMAEPV